MDQLGPLNPKYWYIDEDGKISKYLYCKLCHAGPFKESENKDKFLFFGMDNKSPYCMACSIAHHYFQTDFTIFPKEHKKPQKLEEFKQNTPIYSPFSEEKIIEMSTL